MRAAVVVAGSLAAVLGCGGGNGGTDDALEPVRPAPAEVAVAAGVRSLVLTHFYPRCDGVDIAQQVREAGYAGALHLARDGDVIDVTPGA